MAGKYDRQAISPFPEEINKEYFGAWLSGFTDGEGCFRLSINKRTHSPSYAFLAYFDIGQRSDDIHTIKLIQSYFGCGYTYIDQRHYTKTPSNPKCFFRVSRPDDLVSIIVPHFEKFPLVAKKRSDYLIWKQGVDLIYSVFQRPMTSGGNGKRGRNYKWTPEESDVFRSIHSALRDQRKFGAPRR